MSETNGKDFKNNNFGLIFHEDWLFYAALLSLISISAVTFIKPANMAKTFISAYMPLKLALAVYETSPANEKACENVIKTYISSYKVIAEDLQLSDDRKSIAKNINAMSTEHLKGKK